MKPTLPSIPAVRELEKVLAAGVEPETLDKAYDLLKLMGLVLGHCALLDVATNPASEAPARVAAAKALVAIKESPEALGEKLRRAPFSRLTVEQLRGIVRDIESGKKDITSLLKEQDHASGP